MNKENKMYQYLLEHNYISKNENKNPLRQQELSKERAECIANKYNNLVKELETNWDELKKWLEENESFDYCCNETTFTAILNKMQELEGKSE